SNSLVPIGVMGEICIGGSSLARGYLNQAELTEEKFITNPFVTGERLYKTGDLGRWLADGNVEYLGRKDDQVKIRGYRIELGEIEHALLSNNLIESAIVVVAENEGQEKQLIAYLASSDAVDVIELRAYLKTQLPAYMIPAHFVQLEELPLTANGKIDKRALPNPDGLGLSSGVEYVAPSTELEQQIVTIWENVLQREKVGVKDDFFELGGHSLKAIKLINEYQKIFEVKLSINELFINTRLELHLELIQSAGKTSFIEIPIQEKQVSYAISDAQRRLWVLSQFEEGSAAYNMPSQVYLNQEINIENFTKAINATIERHEILRTVFEADEEGTIRQWVLEKAELDFEITYQDFRNDQIQEQVKHYILADSSQSFDLEKGPLFRIALLQIEDNAYVFYFNMHHIISDGWSMSVLSKDVFTFYEAFEANREPELKDLRIQYKDYAAWQLNQLKEETFKGHQNYWLNHLSGELPLLDLPSSKQRPIIKTNNGLGLSTYLDETTTAQLKKHAQQNGGSLFMTLLATWNVLFYRYTAQKNIIIGTPIAGRDHADLEDQIGCYLNTLALRNELNPSEGFNEFYKKVKTNTLASYSHQMYPFDRLVEELGLQRDISRSAVFDVMLTLQNTGENTAKFKLNTEQLNLIVAEEAGASKFDIDFTFQEMGDYLSMHAVYNPDVYDKEMVEDLIKHYKQLLVVVLANPELGIEAIDYLSDQEEQALLLDFNNTKIVYQQDKTIVDLFYAQAERTPNEIAVVFEATELTYQTLNEKSNQLAHYLQSNYAIKPDDLVGIQLERSEWMIIAILAVLKSGGAYVPIDPNNPQERVNTIVEDSQAKIVLDKAELSRFNAAQKLHPVAKVITAVNPNNLAYVIYTSGSTGKPKGVMLEHGNVTNFFEGMNGVFGNERGTFLSLTNYTFDISVLELLWTLTKGYKVVLQGDVRAIVEGDYSVYAQIKKHAVTHMQATPSMGTILNEYFSDDKGWQSLKTILLGGEPLTVSLAEGIYTNLAAVQIYNMYGPTETTIWSSVKKIEPGSNFIEIGHPIANTQIYILDSNKKIVPIGVQGEIYIGGNGVARGYTNHELSKVSFIESPFQEGGRLYKTGDYGLWMKNGSIYCIGRKDQQVKIRGHRIELGEIEQALLKNDQLKDVVVVLNDKEEKELVAYVTAKQVQKDDAENLNAANLRAYLKDHLPEYMIPSYFVALDKLPLNNSGKVDKKALPEPEGLALSGGNEYVAPRNEMEEKLADIWGELLERDKVGIRDDFFALGGNSILVFNLLRLARKVTKREVTIMEFYNSPTIETFTRNIPLPSKHPSLISFKKGKKKNRTIYFLPGLSGSAAYLGPLADKLSKSFNSFAIQSTGMAEGQVVKRTLEDEAQEFVDIIASQEVDSNFVLFGLSFGGYLGFEIAKRLEKLGYSKFSFLICDIGPDIEGDFATELEMKDYLETFEDLRGTLSDGEVDRSKSVAGNNIKMLNKHLIKGKLNMEISCIDAIQNDPSSGVQEWANHTHKKIIVNEFDCEHTGMMEERFHADIQEILTNA
ncbi:MAG: amino acid adenylation domain-containing protein, partial [Crocinitomix sp.]